MTRTMSNPSASESDKSIRVWALHLDLRSSDLGHAKFGYHCCAPYQSARMDLPNVFETRTKAHAATA